MRARPRDLIKDRAGILDDKARVPARSDQRASTAALVEGDSRPNYRIAHRPADLAGCCRRRLAASSAGGTFVTLFGAPRWARPTPDAVVYDHRPLLAAGAAWRFRVVIAAHLTDRHLSNSGVGRDANERSLYRALSTISDIDDYDIRFHVLWFVPSSECGGRQHRRPGCAGGAVADFGDSAPPVSSLRPQPPRLRHGAVVPRGEISDHRSWASAELRAGGLLVRREKRLWRCSEPYPVFVCDRAWCRR